MNSGDIWVAGSEEPYREVGRGLGARYILAIPEVNDYTLQLHEIYRKVSGSAEFFVHSVPLRSKRFRLGEGTTLCGGRPGCKKNSIIIPRAVDSKLTDPEKKFDWTLLSVVPFLGPDWVFLGETDKFLGVSSKRFRSIGLGGRNNADLTVDFFASAKEPVRMTVGFRASGEKRIGVKVVEGLELPGSSCEVEELESVRKEGMSWLEVQVVCSPPSYGDGGLYRRIVFQ